MKILFKIVTLVFMLAGGQVYAAAFTPSDACGTTNINDHVDGSLAALAVCTDAEMHELYKANVGGIDEKLFADSYNTVFVDTASDPSGATISYVPGTDSIVCPDCWLTVKDGKQEPAVYAFDLSSWDGVSDIVLSAFWPDQGAISNVAIWSSSEDGSGQPPPVPLPAAVWLFGSGLVGLIGFSRRKSTSALQA